MSKIWPEKWGKRPQYVTCYRDKPTFQRRKGAPRVTMTTDPATDRVAFEREHLGMMAAAANGTLTARGVGGPQKDGHRDKMKESAGDLVTLFRASEQFKRIKAHTADQYVRHLDRALLTVPVGENRPFAEMKVGTMLQKHAIDLRSALPPPCPKKTRVKSAASYRDVHMNILNTVFAWALGEGSVPFVNRNPFAKLKKLHPKPVNNYAWRPKDWEQYLEFYPLGTRQHLAMLLLRYLGTRVSDLAFLGADNAPLSRLVDDPDPTNKTGKRIEWIEYKNRESVARPIIKHRSLKVHPVLWKALKATPGALDGPTFILSQYGEAMNVSSVDKMFNMWARAAGLPKGCTAHGVRRGGAKLLAESGASTHRIKGWGGWQSLQQVELYTSSANAAMLGDAAIDTL